MLTEKGTELDVIYHTIHTPWLFLIMVASCASGVFNR